MNQCNPNGNERSQKEQIRLLYTALALNPEKEFGWGRGIENARALGYGENWLGKLPAAVWESCAAVGNPFSLGPLHQGDVVVDIGCGAGTDLCIAAELVGPSGRVIGVDLTAPMVEKALANAALCGFSHIKAYIGNMEQLPLPDSCVDLVLSNGSFNLARDKTAALGEAFRILKPGGRLQMADMVRDAPKGEADETTEGSWADCVAGTLSPDCYLQMLQETGFIDAELVALTDYRTSTTTIGATFRARKG